MESAAVLAPLGEVWIAQVHILKYSDSDEEIDARILGVSKDLDKLIKLSRDYIIKTEMEEYDGYNENYYFEDYISLQDREVQEDPILRRKVYLDWLDRKIGEKIDRWLRYFDEPLPKKKRKEKQEVTIRREKLLREQKGFRWNLYWCEFTRTGEY